MTKESLSSEIDAGVSSLLKMAKDICWNTIVPPFDYIITNITDYEADRFDKQRRKRNKLNSSKRRKSFENVISDLEKIYDDLYDINIYVYYANEYGTTIEIQYYPKSAFNPEQFPLIKNNVPMLHMKIGQPKMWQEGDGKFDINWEYNEGY